MSRRDGKVDVNPVKDVKFFKKDNKKERILTPEEIQRLLVECNGHLRPIVQIALNTAMRLREILYLKWCNVDFNRNIIIVTQTKSKKNRNVPMNDLVIEALQGLERKSEYVFCDPETAKPYNSIKTTFGKAIKRVGLLGVRFHDLRHTAASMMVESGVELATVMEILGGSSLEIVMRYVHPTSEGKMNAVKALERQMDDLDSRNTVPTAKRTYMPKAVSNDDIKH